VHQHTPSATALVLSLCRRRSLPTNCAQGAGSFFVLFRDGLAMSFEESSARPHAPCAAAARSRRASAAHDAAGQYPEHRVTAFSSSRCGQPADEARLRNEWSVCEPLDYSLLDLALSPMPPSPAELSCALSLDDLLTASDTSELSEHETQLLLQNGVAPWDHAPEVTRAILQRLQRQSQKVANFDRYTSDAWTVPNVLDHTCGQQWPSRSAPVCTVSTSSSVTAAPAVAAPRLRRNVSVSEMSQWDD
jgi:hypothetical protein